MYVHSILQRLGRFTPWIGILCLVFWGVMMPGCRAVGLHGPSPHRLATATQAFYDQDWTRARNEFTALAAQPPASDAAVAGIYGLACVNMATAADVPSFLEALDSFSGNGTEPYRVGPQNPELFIRAATRGIRLLEAAHTHQASRIKELSREKQRLVQKIRTLENKITTLNHQISVLERIDRELQEKRTQP